MERIPDANKRPEQLREDAGDKAIELVCNSFNRLGREILTKLIRDIEDDYGVSLEMSIVLDFSIKVRPQTGIEFEWNDIVDSD